MCQAPRQDEDLVENKSDLVLPSSPIVTLSHVDINGVNMQPNDLPWLRGWAVQQEGHAHRQDSTCSGDVARAWREGLAGHGGLGRTRCASRTHCCN